MDKKEIARIIKQLLSEGKDITIDNINSQAGKILINEKAKTLEVTVSQNKSKKDTLLIDFKGTGIDIENKLHTEFLNEIIKLLTLKMTEFSIIASQISKTRLN